MDAGERQAVSTLTAVDRDRDREGALRVLAVGAEVGRYRIVGRLGEGGMGVVYEAEDRELGRHVALKVLRQEARGRLPEAEARRARLVREARAMARLAHENVVPVFDAGTLGDEVFVSMELVPGQNLDRWAAAARRTWRELVDVVIGAGRGLAAAHRAGLVHRDVKPSNLLVGADGRARVGDFGLARTVDEVDPAEAVGTPAYMAPEQLEGQAADERSDQYSLALSLHHVVDRLEPPQRLRRVLRRAMSTTPAARYPSVAALVDELAAIRRADRRRRGTALVAAALVATGAGAYGLARATADDDGGPAPCRIEREQLAGVWDSDARAAIGARFAAIDPALGADAARAAATQLDRWTGRWLGERKRACQATRERRELGEDVLVRRTACLDSALDEARALAQLLRHAGAADVVRQAARAALDLPAPEGCADLLALEAALPLPRSADARERIAALRKRVATAAALRRTGQFAEGHAQAEQLVADARALGYSPVLAEALYVAAELEDWAGTPARAEELFRAAAVEAARAGDDVRMATATASLVYVVGISGGRVADALQIGAVAAVPVARSRSRAAEGLLHNNLGTVHWQRGELAEAARELEQAIQLREAALGESHPLVASSLSNLGAVRRLEGKYDEAEALQKRALAILRAALGDAHPEVAHALTNLGTLASSRGDQRAAVAWEEQALAIRRRAHGDDHFLVGQSLNNLGNYASAEGRWAEAVSSLEASARILRGSLGPKHPQLGVALAGLGEAYVHAGRAVEALPILEEAVAIGESSATAPLDLAHARFALGMALAALRRDRARACNLVREADAGYRTIAAERWSKDSAAWLAAHRCRGGRP
ncbi:MAG TPA: serine/threonine-protein kinase [Kofleriaceae bacterium]